MMPSETEDWRLRRWRVVSGNDVCGDCLEADELDALRVRAREATCSRCGRRGSSREMDESVSRNLLALVMSRCEPVANAPVAVADEDHECIICVAELGVGWQNSVRSVSAALPAVLTVADRIFVPHSARQTRRTDRNLRPTRSLPA